MFNISELMLQTHKQIHRRNPRISFNIFKNFLVNCKDGAVAGKMDSFRKCFLEVFPELSELDEAKKTHPSDPSKCASEAINRAMKLAVEHKIKSAKSIAMCYGFVSGIDNYDKC